MSFHSNVIFFEPSKNAQPPEVCEKQTPMRRPPMLWAAARHGQRSYNRRRDLQKLMGGSMEVPPAGQALAWLEQREGMMNDARINRRAEWNLGSHILLLIALQAEKRLLSVGCRPVAQRGVTQGRQAQRPL